METSQLAFMGKLKYSDEDNYIQEFVESLNKHKVLHYTNVPKADDYRVFYAKLADKAGSFVRRNENYKNGDMVENSDGWMDIRFEEGKKTETFRHSDTHQPLHTDGAYTSYSCDISFFFCLEAAPIGGGTTFIDGIELINILREYEPELLHELETTEVLFDKGESQQRSGKIVSYDEQGLFLAWNWFRVSPTSSDYVKGLCDRFHNFLESKIHSGGLLTPVYLKPGEAVFFHDYRVLHGRNAFFGPRCLIKGGINLN